MMDEPELPGQVAEAVRARHEPELLRYPHVVGIAVGERMKAGKSTGELAIVVFVDRKVAEDVLAPDEVLPGELEGVPVDVMESGPVRPLPA